MNDYYKSCIKYLDTYVQNSIKGINEELKVYPKDSFLKGKISELEQISLFIGIILEKE